jgi:hypothetical protein
LPIDSVDERISVIRELVETMGAAAIPSLLEALHDPDIIDVTGVFCTSGREREFTLEESWYADEKVQAGADRDAAAAD